MDEFYQFLIPIFWILSLFFLLFDLSKTIRKNVVYEDTTHYAQDNLKRKKIISPLTKMYAKLAQQNPYELSETLVVELCKDAGIFFNSTVFHFLQVRQKPRELSTYFENEELIFFLNKPKEWTDKQYSSSLSLAKSKIFKKNIEVTENLTDSLNRIIQIFQLELLTKDLQKKEIKIEPISRI